VEYLFLSSLAALYAGALLMVRRNVLYHLEGVAATLEHERDIRRAGVDVLHRRSDDIRETLDDVLEKLTLQADLTDARSTLNADSHAEFRNRLDTVESRLDHTVKAVADTFKRAPKRAKRSK